MNQRRSGACVLNRVVDFALEVVGAEEDERAVEPEQQQSRGRPCLRLALERVESGFAVLRPQDLHLGPRCQLHEAQQRQGDREQDRIDRTDQHHANGHDDGQPRLGAVDPVDHLQLGDVEQRQPRGDQHRGQHHGRHELQRRGEEQRDHGHRQCRDEAGNLRASTRRVRHRGTRIGAADDKALRGGGRDVDGAQRGHLAVRIDRVAVLRSEAACRDHHVGETHQREARGLRDECGQHLHRHGRP